MKIVSLALKSTLVSADIDMNSVFQLLFEGKQTTPAFYNPNVYLSLNSMPY